MWRARRSSPTPFNPLAWRLKVLKRRQKREKSREPRPRRLHSSAYRANRIRKIRRALENEHEPVGKERPHL
ncbi:hypothetical protein AB395_0000883 [Sinorhizobium fredii CCBAU 45436]|nr:hypothetical protein AB395_0000883 [Sinorhizobium fredii CCBAU 45436]